MKTKLLFILIMLVIAMSTGCSNETTSTRYDYHFTGENDFWTADYKVTGELSVDDGNNAENKSHFDYVLTVTYKNDISNLSTVKNLEIDSTSSLNNLSYKLSFPEDGTIQKTYTIKSESNSLNVVEDDTIKVTIKTDENEQTLELKNEASS